MSQKNKGLRIYILLFSIFLGISSLFSCTSQSYWEQGILPGQEDSILQNVAIEYYTIAEAYSDLEKYSKAIDYYKKAMRNKEVYPMAYYKLGRSYALSSDWSNAYKVFKDLYSMDPENTDLCKSLAYVASKNDNFEESCLLYESIIQKNEYDSSILKNFIYLLLLNNKIEEAKSWYETFLVKFPEDSSTNEIKEKIESITTDKTDNVENIENSEKVD